MAKVQAYVSDEIVYKINKIVERRRAEGAKSTDVSFSSISTMLLELGLRVHEAQMERKESAFNQAEFNKVLLECAVKTQSTVAKEGANKRGNSSRLTQSFHFFMFEPIFSPVNALNQPI